jgi:hypothetical protein
VGDVEVEHGHRVGGLDQVFVHVPVQRSVADDAQGDGQLGEVDHLLGPLLAEAVHQPVDAGDVVPVPDGERQRVGQVRVSPHEREQVVAGVIGRVLQLREQPAHVGGLAEGVDVLGCAVPGDERERGFGLRLGVVQIVGGGVEGGVGQLADVRGERRRIGVVGGEARRADVGRTGRRARGRCRASGAGGGQAKGGGDHRRQAAGVQGRQSGSLLGGGLEDAVYRKRAKAKGRAARRS